MKNEVSSSLSARVVSRDQAIRALPAELEAKSRQSRGWFYASSDTAHVVAPVCFVIRQIRARVIDCKLKLS